MAGHRTWYHPLLDLSISKILELASSDLDIMFIRIREKEIGMPCNGILEMPHSVSDSYASSQAFTELYFTR